MKKFVFALVLCGFVGSFVYAQGTVPPATQESKSLTAQIPGTTEPTLTAEQEAVLEAKVMKVEQASRDLSPEGIGKAVTDLITARQQALQSLNGDLSTYVQGLTKPDHDITRDPKTGKFLYVKKAK